MHPVQIYYIILLFLSVVFTLIYTYMWHKHFSVYFSLIFAFIPVANIGYLSTSMATNLEEALMATKIVYFGGCYLVLFITFYIFDMCHVKLPKALKIIMIALSTIIYAFVLTIERGHLFYDEVSFSINENSLPVLTKTYGPVHTLFYIFVGICFITGFTTIIYSYFKKRNVSRRIIWLLFIPEFLAAFAFFVIRLFIKDIEFTPMAYVFAQVMYILIGHYICIYNVTDTAIDTLVESGATGFISFDFNMNYLGSTSTARKIFPELRNLTIDKPLKRDPKLYDRFAPWIKEYAMDDTHGKNYYTHDEHIYLVDINHLIHEGKSNGYQFVITDDTKNQKYIELIDNYNSNLEKEVKEKTADIIAMHNNLIRSMAMLVESRDNSTGGHIVRTSDVVEILMDEIMKDTDFIEQNGITEEFKRDIIKAAPLHDIGKISVEDDVLKKPGRFNDEEFEKMKQHAPEGARVLHSILKDTTDDSFKKLAENVAHYHHERMDGSGYPDHLIADQIPMEARIMAIADVYDALVSKRVYKDSMSFEKADEIIMESMGKHFDKRLEKFYIAARPRIEEYYSKISE